MAVVPDTNTFSLQDVENAIPGVQGGLVACFADAHADGFDPAYGGSEYVGVGTGYDRLSNFRNYKHATDFSHETESGAYDGMVGVIQSGTSWTSIRNSSVGNQYDTDIFKLRVAYVGGNRQIQRSMLHFDLSAIPVNAIIVDGSVELHMKILYQAGNYGPYYPADMIACEADDPIGYLGNSDYGAFDFDDWMLTTYSIYLDNGKYVTKLSTTPGDEARDGNLIENHFGGDFRMIVLDNIYDFDDVEPADAWWAETQFYDINQSDPGGTIYLPQLKFTWQVQS